MSPHVTDMNTEALQTRSVSALDIAEALGMFPPTTEQQAVIEAPLSPTLVVAGAGSGKTETMANRVLWLLANNHARPDQIGRASCRERVYARV